MLSITRTLYFYQNFLLIITCIHTLLHSPYQKPLVYLDFINNKKNFILLHLHNLTIRIQIKWFDKTQEELLCRARWRLKTRDNTNKIGLTKSFSFSILCMSAHDVVKLYVLFVKSRDRRQGKNVYKLWYNLLLHIYGLLLTHQSILRSYKLTKSRFSRETFNPVLTLSNCVKDWLSVSFLSV